MRKRTRSAAGKRGGGKIKWFLCMVLIFVLMVYSIIYTDRIIKPTLTNIAEVKGKSMMAQLIYDSVREKFEEDVNSAELLTIMTDSEGKVTYVQANTAAMNQLSSDLTYRIQSRIKEMEPIKIDLPVGALLGSEVLSQVGPSLPFKLTALGAAKVNIKTEFESTGINQTRHKVYLQVDSTIKMLVPFMEENLELVSTVLIAETVIVGDVPETYIYVPEKDILDALRAN